MLEVSQRHFFATIGRLDVHPRVDESTLRERFHTSHWELRDRTVVGKSVSDSWGIAPGRYWVPAAQ